MEKYFILFLFSFLIIASCQQDVENSDNIPVEKTIKIKTEYSSYTSNEFIKISITNNLDSLATGFLCDNYYLPPTTVLKKDSYEWEEQLYPVWCTFMGPSGYYAELTPGTTEIYENAFIDPYTFNPITGTYKYKYQFIFELDTAFYYSNEFRIID